MTTNPQHHEAGTTAWQPALPDLSLILEQLQEQIDDLRQTLEAQQRLNTTLMARLDALERR